MIKNFIVGPLESNCYLYGDEKSKKAVLIDPGDEGEKIFQFVRSHGWELTAILITHGHPDHLAALPYLKKQVTVPVYLHREDYLFLTNFDYALVPFLEKISLKPEKFFQEGEEIAAGEKKLKVLFTPGHSPGGVCLLGEGIVFTGDTLFCQSIGRTDLPGGDTQKLFNSIRTKLFILPEPTIVYPGHGESSTIGEEKKHNPFSAQIMAGDVFM
ncbi:MAG: MBL fold metallo-hydrolase [Elusimicrobiota bacterium]